jgi:DNA-binding NtrC family response regulator
VLRLLDSHRVIIDQHLDGLPPEALIHIHPKVVEPNLAMEALTRYPWPGNIRQLQNVIERAVILSPGPVLHRPLAELAPPVRAMPSRGKTLEDVEREHILKTLRETHGVVGGPQGVAACLGVKRTTLIYKMERLGISRQL